jgi:hypothetical protein
MMPMVGVIAMPSHPTPANSAQLVSLPRQIALKGGLLLAASLAALLGLFVASALAVVTPVGENSYGVTPRILELVDGVSNHAAKTEPGTFANLEGHAVVRSSNLYVVYWDPTDDYHGDWQQAINEFLRKVGAASGSLSNVFAVDTQYMDKTNHRGGYNITFHGAYTDTDPYPTSGNCEDPQPLSGGDAITCVTDAQIRTELKSFAAQHALQTGMNAIFYVLTPPGVTVCLDGGGAAGHCSDYESSPKSYENSFCSYHAAINPTNSTEGAASTILYAVVPWIAGGLGDYHLQDEASAYDCQDGGHDPTSKPVGEVEHAKEKNAAEIEAFNKMDNEEKAKQEEKERLEGPHQQEPNQGGKGPDGSYDSGLADLIINQIAVEQQNTTTDPLLNAWKDHSGNEVMDECRNFFAPTLGGSLAAQESTEAGSLFNQTIDEGNYYLNDTFNLAAEEVPYPGVPCINNLDLAPEFTSPNPVNAGELVGFDGMESNITLDGGVSFSSTSVPQATYPTYTWNFGDGSAPISGFAPGAPSVNSPGVAPCAEPWEAPCAASTFHSYEYGGTYEVTLTVTDVGGNVVSVTKPVTVIGPARPSSSPPAGGSTGSGGQAAVTPQSQAPASAPSPAPTPAPILGASVMSKSLKKVLSGGLAVRYTTNEQVAGTIQVLLAATTAKRLGVHGATATGLPKGSSPSIVVGTAVLVTTKAGQGTIRIKFSPRTAAHLKHTHKLTVTLRLFARNASRQSPQTTTLLSTVVLNP